MADSVSVTGSHSAAEAIAHTDAAAIAASIRMADPIRFIMDSGEGRGVMSERHRHDSPDTLHGSCPVGDAETLERYGRHSNRRSLRVGAVSGKGARPGVSISQVRQLFRVR